jgi:CheY-like chemotaxis protein
MGGSFRHPDGNNMTVLLVDDEAILRKMVRLMLQGSGHNVIETATYEEALEAARDHDIDAIVTDVVLNAGDLDSDDGFALAKAIAEHKPDLAVVFMSGYPIDFEGRSGKPLRCGFLRKPFQKADLLNILAGLSIRA